MSIVIGKYYRGDPKQKPKQWGPVSSVSSVLRHRFENWFGIPWKVVNTAIPFWERSGQRIQDYAITKTIVFEQGTPSFEKSGFDVKNNGHGSTNDVISIDSMFIDANTQGNTTLLNLYKYGYIAVSEQGANICSNLEHLDFGIDGYNNDFLLSFGEDNGWRHEGSFGSFVNEEEYTLGWTANAIDNTVDGFCDGDFTSIPKYNSTGFAGRVGTITSKMYFGRYASWTAYFGCDIIFKNILSFNTCLPEQVIYELTEKQCALWKRPTFRTYFDFADSPLVPTITSPLNGAIDVDQPFSVSWTSVDDAIDYQLQIADSEAAIVVDTTITAPTTTKEISGLDPLTTHYARVRAQTS